MEVEFWTHSVSQVPSFVASLRFPSNTAPNLEQSSCGPVKMCTMETILQHGFWCRVSLRVLVVVQCTSFTGNHHPTIRQEKQGWWSDDVLIPFFCVRSARPLVFLQKDKLDCTASATDAAVHGLKSTSTSARAFHCRSTSCTSLWFCDHSL